MRWDPADDPYGLRERIVCIREMQLVLDRQAPWATWTMGRESREPRYWETPRLTDGWRF